MKKIFFILLGASFCCTNIKAQNTSSPYSAIALGDIENSYFDITSGMGHTGVALYSDKFLMPNNPASFALLKDHFFHFEVAAKYKNVNFSGIPLNNATNATTNDLQFKRISFAIKLKKKWGLSVGLLPFSSSNYSYKSTKSAIGTPIILDAYYEGSGSTNLLYISNSYNIIKDKDTTNLLSIGLQASSLFGQINNKESDVSVISDSVLTTNKNYFLNAPYFKAGLLYTRKINKNFTAGFGATYSLQTKVSANYEGTIKDGVTVLKDEKITYDEYEKIPKIYTLGGSLSYNNQFLLAVDYTSQNWGDVAKQGSNYKIINSQRLGVGLQMNTFYDKTSFTKGFYQIGYYNYDTYLQVYGQNISQWGVTFGAGMPLLRRSANAGELSLQANFEFGSRGTIANGLIKENFTQFGVTISYKDFWFTNRKKYF
jgi:hypothetical protein